MSDLEEIMDTRPKTVFCDIDGTLCEHGGDICVQHLRPLNVLPGVLEHLREWDRRGYHIILVTGRRESVREDTVRQLAAAGIIYDQLVMGVGGGTRVLINDTKQGSVGETAISINLVRNQGLLDIAEDLCE